MQGDFIFTENQLLRYKPKIKFLLNKIMNLAGIKRV